MSNLHWPCLGEGRERPQEKGEEGGDTPTKTRTHKYTRKAGIQRQKMEMPRRSKRCNDERWKKEKLLETSGKPVGNQRDAQRKQGVIRENAETEKKITIIRM